MRILLLITFMYCSVSLFAKQEEKQTKSAYTLEKCQDLAKNNYPVIKNYNLIDQSANYSVNNASKIWIPQVTLSAQEIGRASCRERV